MLWNCGKEGSRTGVLVFLLSKVLHCTGKAEEVPKKVLAPTGSRPVPCSLSCLQLSGFHGSAVQIGTPIEATGPPCSTELPLRIETRSSESPPRPADGGGAFGKASRRRVDGDVLVEVAAGSCREALGPPAPLGAGLVPAKTYMDKPVSLLVCRITRCC